MALKDKIFLCDTIYDIRTLKATVSGGEKYERLDRRIPSLSPFYRRKNVWFGVTPPLQGELHSKGVEKERRRP